MSNLYTTLNRAALLGSVASVVLAISPVTQAVAQDADDVVEEVVVTGSRIVRQNLVAASPVTQMTAEEISVTGTTRIEDLVQALPQAFAAQNSTVANGSTGTATVNLRKLGSNRTLVLINGRRMMPGDPMSPASDLNFIPSTLVKRVDVLTGGASSVYGTDAVAGVVNFVLDTDFEGLKTSAQYGFYQHNNRNKAAQAINEAKGFDVPKGNITDGGQLDLNLAVGGSFADGKGHASAYIGYRKIEQIVKSGRDYTNCTINAYNSGMACGGSSTTPWGTFITESNGTYLVDPDTGEFRLRDGEVFNYGPFNHIQRPDEKFTAGAFVNYQINDKVESYTEVMFMDDYSEAQIAPSGNFYRTSSINCDNPMLSAVQKTLICGGDMDDPLDMGYADDESAPLYIGRRNIEGGNRRNDMRHTNYRLVQGFRGQLDDTWSYDVYGMYARSIFSEQYVNDLNTNRIKDALDVVLDADGNMVCRSGNEGCAPWNIFTKGGVTQEALDYISTIAVAKGETKTQMVSASFTGNLGDYGVTSPMASEGVSIALGAEYRKESLSYEPDEVFAKGLRAGSGGSSPPVAGSFDVKEIFAEAVVPLVQDAEFAQELSLEFGYRYSEYNLSGGTNTFKVAANWVPIDDVRFRAGFNRAVRAPNIVELFDPAGFGLGGNEDYCAGDAIAGADGVLRTFDKDTGFTAAECLNTGVPLDVFGSVMVNEAHQYNTFGGGNPNLQPESADTITVGVVLTPAAVPGLSVSVDYYDIKVSNTIGTLDPDEVLKNCARTGDETLCGLVNRDEVYSLFLTQDAFTVTQNINVGVMRARGVDVNASYSTDIADAGTLNFDLVGTYLLESTYGDPLTAYDCKGLFGSVCGSPASAWRHKARVTWDTNFDASISMAWRYTGGATNESQAERYVASGIASVSAQSFFDIAVSYDITEDATATFGINNFLDKEPPLFPGLSSTGYGATYDTLGRYVFAGIKANF